MGFCVFKSVKMSVSEQSTTETAQGRFDKKYISSTEIMSSLGISRSVLLYARRTGRLPGAIIVNEALYLWERETIQPYLDAWKLMLNARRKG